MSCEERKGKGEGEGEVEGEDRMDEVREERRTNDLSKDVEETFSDVGCCYQDDGSGERRSRKSA